MRTRFLSLSLVALVGCGGGGRPSTTDATISGRTVNGTEFELKPLTIQDGRKSLYKITDSVNQDVNASYSPLFSAETQVDGERLHGELELNTQGRYFGDLFPGPDSFNARVNLSGAITGDFTQPTSGTVVVHRVKWVGDGASTFEWTGTHDVTFKLDGAAEVRSKGDFTLYNDCGDGSDADLCGPTTPNLEGLSELERRDVNFNNPMKGTFKSGVVQDDLGKPCPDALVAPYVALPDWSYDVTSFTLGDAQRLDCVQNGEARLCGHSRDGVEADGCTWSVDVFAHPTFRTGILGVANESCAREGGRYCRTFIR